MNDYRIVICDDQTLIRKSLAIVLERHPGLVVAGEAADGNEAVQRAESLQPDLILMDIRMPGMDGIQATRVIRGNHPDIRIVALTTFEDHDLIADCLDAGAIGYLLKDLTADDLIKAIELIRNGEAVIPASYIRNLTASAADRQRREVSPGTQQGLPSKPAIDLTDKEKEVLSGLLEGLSNKEIGAKLFMSDTTVKNHLSGIFAKMDVRDRTQAVLFAIQHGLHPR